MTRHAPVLIAAITAVACVPYDQTGPDTMAEITAPVGERMGRCIDFEAPLTVGTTFGAPAGTEPGETLFTRNGIAVDIGPLTLADGGTAYNAVEIVPVTAVPGAVGFGDDQLAGLDNVTLAFRTVGLDFPVNRATFSFADLGGIENIQVNGLPQPPRVGQLASDPVGEEAITVIDQPVDGARTGQVTVTGPIESLRIGGESLLLDDVCFYER